MLDESASKTESKMIFSKERRNGVINEVRLIEITSKSYLKFQGNSYVPKRVPPL